MTREEWRRVKQVTAAALDEPETDRSSYVTRACGGDVPLEREVRSLLSSAISATPLFETPVFAAALSATAVDEATRAPAARVGDRIGPYRIIKEIGRGGMGTVFLAERAEEYQQRVALKIVHDARSSEALRWFREERQILASLEHPHIARLMDGGTTADGLPYLVMEYVEGVPIDDYCSDHALGIRERLEIFRTICSAVDVAHRNLIVHRDLKPRNILVSDGDPKLVDFGIAKLLEPAAQAATAPASGSHTGPALLTPEYASPEQLKREPITTATDVYALGVLLYHLLTGRSPYDVQSDTPHQLAAAICDEEPRRPSAAAGTRRLRRQLSGDLDTIVLKALKKDPASRYSSAGALADDISRHLTGLPLAARHDGMVYRARKFVARHRVGVVATALVILSLAGGLVAALWEGRETERQRQLAQRHFDDVRRLASSLIFEVQDSIENLPGTVQARQLLVKRALEYFDSLAAEDRDNVQLQRELAQGYDRLGNVQGRPYAANLGDTTAALASYRKALEIRERLARTGPPDSRSRLDLWASYFNMGGILREISDTRGALLLHQKARDVVNELLLAAPEDPALIRAEAQTASTLSVSYVQTGHLDDAANAAREVLSLDERLLAREPDNPLLRNEVASAHGRLGQILLKLGDRAGARAQFQPAFQTATALVAAQPSNVTFRRRLSSTHSHFAQLLVREGDVASAWPHQQMALALRQGLVDQNRADRQASIDLMVSHLETGLVLAKRRDVAGAADHYRIAIARGDPMIAADPSYVYHRLIVATALTRLGGLLLSSGHGAEAALLVRRAIELLEPTSAKDSADARLRFELAMAYASMGDIQSTDGAEWYTRSLNVFRQLQMDGLRAGGVLDPDEPEIVSLVERKLSGERRSKT
jgi:non-specific serine/threonine protein kinase/serine/threonine-protein kinase